MDINVTPDKIILSHDEVQDALKKAIRSATNREINGIVNVSSSDRNGVEKTSAWGYLKPGTTAREHHGIPRTRVIEIANSLIGRAGVSSNNVFTFTEGELLNFVVAIFEEVRLTGEPK